MKEKKLSTEEIKKVIDAEKVYQRVPFTTHFQDEVQKTIKELWEDQEAFFYTHGKLWLNQKTTNFKKNQPTIFIYSKLEQDFNGDSVYECNDEDYGKQGFNVEIINFENYSPYENQHINIIGTDDKNLQGIALVAIVDILYSDYLAILNYH